MRSGDSSERKSTVRTINGILRSPTRPLSIISSTPLAPSAQERLLNYGSEALDTVEHLGLILKDQEKALALLEHFGSIANLARASVQDLSAFLSRDKAAQLISSLRLALRF
jgi:DNA repair protein RadC